MYNRNIYCIPLFAINCTDRSDCQHPVLLVCDFIQHQAMKDRPQHNKDLHTSIVAALNTLLRWINAHPYLLGYKVNNYRKAQTGIRTYGRTCIIIVLADMFNLKGIGTFNRLWPPRTFWVGGIVPVPGCACLYVHIVYAMNPISI